MSDRRALLAFFGVAFAITWGFAAIFWITQSDEANPSPPIIHGLSYLAVWGPSLAGLSMAWRLEGREGARRLLARLWRTPSSRLWLLVALAIPIAIEAAGALAATLFAEGYAISRVGPESWARAGLFLAFTVSSGPLGEEFGWRGFALPRMADAMGPKTAALCLAAVWALWHLPAFVVPGLQDLIFPKGVTFLELAAILMGGGVVSAWLTFRSGGALGPAVLFHLGLLCVLMIVKQNPPEVLIWTGAGLHLAAGLALLAFSPDLGRRR